MHFLDHSQGKLVKSCTYIKRYPYCLSFTSDFLLSSKANVYDNIKALNLEQGLRIWSHRIEFSSRKTANLIVFLLLSLQIGEVSELNVFWIQTLLLSSYWWNKHHMLNRLPGWKPQAFVHYNGEDRKTPLCSHLLSRDQSCITWDQLPSPF